VNHHSASFYLPGCKAAINVRELGTWGNDPIVAGMCLGLLKGMSIAFATAKQNRSYCMPDNASVEQVARVLVAYMEARPERLHEDVLSIASDAFKGAWPCR
jgi:Ssp1 endopeptidase immunity protein Rap1a